jgi:hypothetical protein
MVHGFITVAVQINHVAKANSTTLDAQRFLLLNINRDFLSSTIYFWVLQQWGDQE